MLTGSAVVLARSLGAYGATQCLAPLQHGQLSVTSKTLVEGAAKGGPEPPKEDRPPPVVPPQTAGSRPPGPPVPPAGSADYGIALKLAQQLAQPLGGPVPAGAAGLLSGVKSMHLGPRKVLIISNARSPEQQGRQRTAFNRSMPHWCVDFVDPSIKWMNPLIGWTSTSDPRDQAAVALQFYTAQEAVAFCERQGWEYEVQDPNPPPDSRGRRWAAYGDNFSIKRHGLPDLSHLDQIPESGTKEGGGPAGRTGERGAAVEGYSRGAAGGSN